ncbi:MAG: NAD(P)/FAD-dependent oxidoreductase [Deltaproteobacteria bacterium]|jgi:cyclohexanone monooxygenase|nr:NAD(P)/FAD-dependent oxidoreductase [Deltaproteobacteria bacterium]
MRETAAELDADVVVVGAGMSGLYALKLLREQGRSVVVLEKGDGVGGTWFWNRYPGSRCDVPSLEYSFGFDPELEQEWVWTEHFAAQPEIERYLNHIADRYDLRRDIRLGTGVTAATFDESTDTWMVQTEHGEQLRTRVCIMATGGLSAPNRPDFPGIDDFEGTIVQTSLWPTEGVDLEGRRIGIIGTGSSGVQSIPELAKVASHLTVFQRTPTFTWPSENKPLSNEEQAAVKSRYRELREEQRASFSGTAGTTGAVILQLATGRNILESSPEEREAALSEHGFNACRLWDDTNTDLDANEMAVELFREMIRRTIDDPEIAESLSPRGYPLGCKRPVIDAGYFEAFNRDNVTLVDLRKGGIETITPTGIRTTQGHVELDVIVLATGFDAMTGALSRIDVRGRGGRLLRDEWADGARTYLGLSVAGFPNFFVVVGPGSPSVLASYPTQIELQVGWIADFVNYLFAHGLTRAEAEEAAQEAWTEHVREVAQGTMFTAASCNSWYNGQNIEGKPRVFLPYVGGLPAYMERCEAAASKGYEGFVLR